jgi:type IV secretory pathway TrbL component
MALEVLVLFVFAGVALLIVGVHFYVALQMFVLTLDWYLTVSITSLLIPFAVNKHTSPLASSALNAVVGKSIQLAVMIMVLGMFGRALDGLQLSAAPTLYEMLALLLGTSTLAFMIARVPEISRGIFSSGGQAIDVGGIVVAAASGAASAMAAGALASAKGVGDRDVFGDGDDPGAGSGAPRGGGGAGGEAIELAGLDATTMEPSSGADEPPLVMGEGGAVASEAQADRALSQDDRRAELERSDALTDAVRSRGSQEQPMSVEEALRELDSRDDDDEGARPEVSSGADQEDGQW